MNEMQYSLLLEETRRVDAAAAVRWLQLAIAIVFSCTK